MNRAGQPRCLLLDIGMVLVGLDFKPLADRMQILAGLEPERLQTVFSAENLVRKYESGKISETDFHAEVCRRIGTYIPWDEFWQAWCSVFAQPLLPDELLDALARQTPLWALSNTNKFHFEYLRTQYTFLRHFTGFVLSHEVGALKPDPRIFLQALEKTGMPPSDVLFADDLEANVRAARALGIGAFQFLDAEQFAAEMRSRGLC
jgi:putative hydrolase of the HAD superfamily